MEADDLVGAKELDTGMASERNQGRFGVTVQKSWLFGIAGGCFGVAAGRWLSGGTGALRRRVLLVVAAVLCAAADPCSCRGWGSYRGAASCRWQWWRQTGALLAVAVALQFSSPAASTLPAAAWRSRIMSLHTRWVLPLAGLTMGIYLVHPWVHARMRDQVWPWLDLPPQTLNTATLPLLLPLVWGLSALLVALLRRTPARSVL